jgi:hypothetical protein
MRSHVIGTVCVGALLLAASAGRADTVTLQSNYGGFVGLKHNLTSYDGSPESTLAVSFDGQGASSFIGAYNWTVNASVGAEGTFSPGQTIFTYCIEKSQSFNVFQSYDFNTNAAVVGSPLTGPDQGAVNQLAGLQIQSLINNHWSEALGSNVGAAAFQMAVWEIEYDGGGRSDVFDGTPHSADYYFALGRIRAGAGDNTTGSNAIGLATQWLNGLTPADSITSAVGLNSDSRQDQLTAVPLPAALPVAGATLIGLFGVRKLRRRRAA